MKFNFFIFSFLLIFLVGTFAIVPFVYAACSLGANPLHANANAKPGQTVEVVWNFYNLYGDRTTHVLVSKSEGADWEISYEPNLHEAQYEVSGVIEIIEENLFLEKKDVVLKVPDNFSIGEIYLKHPKEEGYIPAKQLKIFIKVPENAELWKDYKFVFNGNGKCFSEPGTVIPGIATQLEVNIRTTTEYYEKPYEEKETSNQTSLGKKIISLFSGEKQLSPVTMIATGTSLILLIIFVVLVILARRKAIKKGVKEEIKILKPSAKKRK